MKAIKLIMLLCITLFVFNCSNDSEDDLVNVDPPMEEPGDTPVNYVDDIAPIMSTSCVGCHADPPRNGAPFSLVNFSQVNQRATGVFNRMNLQSGSAGAMPPSGRLPQATIDKIQQWIDDGKKEN